jgi:hypothetical protein
MATGTLFVELKKGTSNKPQVSKPNPQAAVASQSTNASENSLPSLSVNSLEHGNTAAGQ